MSQMTIGEAVLITLAENGPLTSNEVAQRVAAKRDVRSTSVRRALYDLASGAAVDADGEGRSGSPKFYTITDAGRARVPAFRDGR